MKGPTIDPLDHPQLIPLLRAAREEAGSLRHPHVGAEHLLLALTRHPLAPTKEWERRHLAPAAVRNAVLNGVRKGANTPSDPATLPVTSRARKALASAARADHPGPESLLAALGQERHGIVARVLRTSANEPQAGRPVGPRGRPGPLPTTAPTPPGGQRAENGGSSDGEPSRWLALRAAPLLAIPGSLVAVWTHQSPLLVFVLSAVAIVPVAGYMGEATEHLAARTGPTMGGFLNATFGNAAELIIGIAALRAGLVELVKASVIGSILGNLLLILGLSLLAAGANRPVLRFNRTAAGMSAAMMTLAVMGLAFPALFHALHPGAAAAERHLSEGVALILALTYILSLVFSLKTHRRLFGGGGHAEGLGGWSVAKSVAVLASATAVIAVESELLVHAVEPMSASVGLATGFVGLIVIPLVGNAAEHATAVLAARKGQMDLALNIAMGSSTQIALFVTPVLVFVGIALGQGMNLAFAPFEVLTLGLATVVVAIITLDGESHWFEGVQLLAVYAMIAVAVFFI